ncbi:GntR family transcriptional regulator [Paenibacillus sacheonensis]|uniref:FCD domain-containing protein n=1 Tax=Paenibacillus sacheonensis TaxID=742054 RepID=A0A7X4YN01_9BACL|nr:GntR family transcriptional regulator [Paenibacillus sacheonensis]MBM7564819.1 DNA-binding GntR family transcriptional regulator [Paenibacillus sacheonensis]NBC69367.1 FCD domain-containing protein [Paenibacillus sacheonensis]
MTGKSFESLNKADLEGQQDRKEAVYRKLKVMMMRREFTPNERIDAADIAEKLGVSRTPVRDALNMLDAEGFVTTVPRQGIYVKGVYREDLMQIFGYREMVELYALDVGFEALSRDWARIAEIIREFDSLIGQESWDGFELMEADIKLHKTIVSYAGNKLIGDSYDKLNGHVQMARAYYLQDLHRMRQSHDEHQAFLQALRDGDKPGAMRLLKQHLEMTLHNILKLIEIYKVF